MTADPELLMENQQQESTITYKPKFDKRKYYFDKDAADFVIEFIEDHCIDPISGDPFILMMWEIEIIYDFFGVKRKEDGFRKYIYLFLEIPKKNGKTGFLQALNLYLLCGDGEKSGRVYCCAGDEDQARILFDGATQMVKDSEFLSARLALTGDRISHPKSGSHFNVLTSKSETKHGFNVSAVTFDELHVQPNDKLYETLSPGIVLRDQPAVIMITTAGYSGTWAKTMHDYAYNIKRGVFKNDAWLVKIYAAKKDAKWDNYKEFKKANPSFESLPGFGKRYYEMRMQELRNRPTARSAWMRLHMNIWSSSEIDWLADTKWDKCNKAPIDLELLKGRECYGGLDFSEKIDLSSYSLIFPPFEGCPWITWVVWFWCPRDTILEKQKSENTNYEVWADDGHILTIPGDTVEHPIMEKFVVDSCGIYDVKEIGYDRFKAVQTVIKLQDQGINCIDVPMTPGHMTIPVDNLETWILKKQINHGGNPVLAWQSGNMILKEDYRQNKIPDRKRSKDKIDGMVSGLIAIHRYLGSIISKPKKSIYETRGVVSFSFRDE